VCGRPPGLVAAVPEESLRTRPDGILQPGHLSLSGADAKRESVKGEADRWSTVLRWSLAHYTAPVWDRVMQTTSPGEVRMTGLWMSGLCVGLLVVGCGGGNTGPQNAQEAVPGTPRATKTAVLETAANMLQADAPVSKISMYLNGFHAAKDNAQMQMEAHHYCNQMNEDFAQCVLFDGNTGDARLMGIEYIVSATVYDTLPKEERAFWHPHNFEILSGQLRLPGIPDVAEKQALEAKINSYGKTWHTWMTGMHGSPSDALPLGAPSLQWSLNRDGEELPGIVEARDKRMSLNTAEARRDRADLARLAQPQGGVAAMAAHVPNAKRTIAGVSDNGDPATMAIPTWSMKESGRRQGR
jgi:hypothetical protein